MTTSGVRYGFAVCQYVYALHLVFNKKSWLPALFFALFATQIHVSFAFFIPISVLLYWLCSTKRKTIVFFGLLSVVLIPIISHFSYLLGRRADWYFGGGNRLAKHIFPSFRRPLVRQFCHHYLWFYSYHWCQIVSYSFLNACISIFYPPHQM
jgi:hypothetical protein